MDTSEASDRIIGYYEKLFRDEIKKEIEDGRLSQEQYEHFLPVINQCIEFFAWCAAVDIVKAFDKP